MKRLTVAATLAFALVSGASPSGGVASTTSTAPVKSTSYDSGGTTPLFIYDNNREAQAFSVPSAVTLNKVSLQLSKDGLPGDPIHVEIRSDAAGKPGALLGTTVRTGINLSPDFTDFNFSGIR